MHTKSGLRVLLESKINRPDSVITDVITLLTEMRNETSTLDNPVNACRDALVRNLADLRCTASSKGNKTSSSNAAY